MRRQVILRCQQGTVVSLANLHVRAGQNAAHQARRCGVADEYRRRGQNGQRQADSLGQRRSAGSRSQHHHVRLDDACRCLHTRYPGAMGCKGHHLRVGEYRCALRSGAGEQGMGGLYRVQRAFIGRMAGLLRRVAQVRLQLADALATHQGGRGLGACTP